LTDTRLAVWCEDRPSIQPDHLAMGPRAALGHGRMAERRPVRRARREGNERTNAQNKTSTPCDKQPDCVILLLERIRTPAIRESIQSPRRVRHYGTGGLDASGREYGSASSRDPPSSVGRQLVRVRGGIVDDRTVARSLSQARLAPQRSRRAARPSARACSGWGRRLGLGLGCRLGLGLG